ncbi:pimeloyl-[acyl-carrier protein] methyl ester esterase [Luteimonas terricola]|uniref:Pimeloyl-[acyl-carrier protein] methyl ester esterase n=1 Tax=Luteimonas terricola TaxID=645597 RepID=A0ABQ2E7H3_9GAMM|nr:pimeloyl-[acyl-carrier protein] methyl ester esterase [Luteimonas terricola]
MGPGLRPVDHRVDSAVNRCRLRAVDSARRGFQTSLFPASLPDIRHAICHPGLPAAPRDSGGRVSTDLHIEVRGAGAPLVLLHGWAMHGGVFAPLAERLAGRFELHLVDLPGHGRSRDSAVALEPDAVVEAVAAQVPVAPWLGWSLGGMFALRAAAMRPAQVPALVMMCSAPRFVRESSIAGAALAATPVPIAAVAAPTAADSTAAAVTAATTGDDARYGMSPEIFAGFARGLREDYHGTLERFIALEAFGSDDARGELRALRNEVFARGEPPAEALAQGLDLLQSVDQRPLLPALEVPSLWIAGRRDRVVDPRAMRAAAAHARDAGFVQIEHGGHAPFLTHADEVADAVAGFLLKTHAGTHADMPAGTA